MTIWDVDKASDRFNYIYLDKKVFYISRKKQTICSSPGEAIEFQPKINQGEMLSSFDISNQMEFYYTICHTNNRSKLHRSSQSPGVFLVGGDNQEFYPHVSPDGDYIGYIERDQHHQWFYHCALPLTGTQGKIIRSKRNFEIDQNARLYEYDLMHYWESTLCFFRFSGVHYEKEPEEPLLNKVGLFFLDSKSGDLSIIETDKFAALNGNRIMKIAIDKPSESIKSEFLEGIKYKIFLVSDAIPFYWKKKKMYALLVTVETSIYKLAKKSEKYDGILIIDSTNIVPQMNR
ncbi:MAG: hypothetical protein MUF15_04090 [Acidobacteria bacterium]|nr:hypothetical protein [Acidobacteriota bacterium]